jgi:hypothetical protein
MKGACHLLEGNHLILLEADLKNPGLTAGDCARCSDSKFRSAMRGACHLLEGNSLILLEADFKVPV